MMGVTRAAFESGVFRNANFFREDCIAPETAYSSDLRDCVDHQYFSECYALSKLLGIICTSSRFRR